MAYDDTEGNYIDEGGMGPDPSFAVQPDVVPSGNTGASTSDFAVQPPSDWSGYLAANPDVAAAATQTGVDPTAFAQQHYAQFGQGEGRTGAPNFAVQPEPQATSIGREEKVGTSAPNLNFAAQGYYDDNGNYVDPGQFAINAPATSGGSTGNRYLTNDNIKYTAPTANTSTEGYTDTEGNYIPPVQDPYAGGFLSIGDLNIAAPTLHEAGGGFSTPYYEARTNSGDLAAAVMAGEGQQIRLLDGSGNVIYQGTGPNGSRDVAALANYLSSTDGKNAAWNVQVDQGGKWTSAGYESVDKVKQSTLGKVADIALPIALSLLAPGIGTALGFSGLGIGGSVAARAAAQAIGSGLGSAISSVGQGRSGSDTLLRALTSAGGSYLGSTVLPKIPVIGQPITTGGGEHVVVPGLLRSADRVLNPLVNSAGHALGLTGDVGQFVNIPNLAKDALSGVTVTANKLLGTSFGNVLGGAAGNAILANGTFPNTNFSVNPAFTDKLTGVNNDLRDASGIDLSGVNVAGAANPGGTAGGTFPNINFKVEPLSDVEVRGTSNPGGTSGSTLSDVAVRGTSNPGSTSGSTLSDVLLTGNNNPGGTSGSTLSDVLVRGTSNPGGTSGGAGGSTLTGLTVTGNSNPGGTTGGAGGGGGGGGNGGGGNGGTTGGAIGSTQTPNTGGNTGGNFGAIGTRASLSPIFSAKLPASRLNLARTPVNMPLADWLRYGINPRGINPRGGEAAFFDYAVNPLMRPVAAAKGGHMRAFAVDGPGTGRSDSIPARLSDGEYVIDAETVALLGDGSGKAGAKKLDQFRVNLRKQKGANLAKGKFSTNARKPEAYLSGGRI
jgi:hypothetical protein